MFGNINYKVPDRNQKSELIKESSCSDIFVNTRITMSGRKGMYGRNKKLRY